MGSTQPRAFLADSVIDPTTLPVDQSLGLSPTAYVQQPFMFEPMKSAQQPSIVGGLFSPELRSAAEMEYLQNRQKAMKDEALAFAQLTPMQQAQFGFYRGGQQLGDALSGALGGQDPQLRMIGLQQQILSELDPSDPEQQLMVAKKYANVAPTLALKIADDARKGLSELALAKQRVAEKMTPEQRNALAYADTVAAKGTPEHTEAYKTRLDQLSVKPEATSTEMKNASAIADSRAKRGTQAWNDTYNAELIRLTTKEAKEPSPNIKEIGVAEGTREPVYLDVNTDTQYTYKKGADGKQVRVPYFGGVDRTTAKVSASASSVGETAFTKQLGELDAKKVAQAIDTRDSAIASLNSLDRLNRLNEQDLISGSFATGRVGATNFLATLGLASGKDLDRLSASENYQKTAGDVILATLGGRLGAGFSNEDRKFIQSLVPQLENSPQARKQLIEFMVKKNQGIIDETTRLENYAREKNSLKGYVPKIPFVSTTKSSLESLSDAELLKQAQEKGIKVKPKQ